MTTLNDAQMSALNALGYVGTLDDRLYQYFTAPIVFEYAWTIATIDLDTLGYRRDAPANPSPLYGNWSPYPSGGGLSVYGLYAVAKSLTKFIVNFSPDPVIEPTAIIVEGYGLVPIVKSNPEIYSGIDAAFLNWMDSNLDQTVGVNIV